MRISSDSNVKYKKGSYRWLKEEKKLKKEKRKLKKEEEDKLVFL